MISTWSSCIELSVERYFITLSTQKGLSMFGSDAHDVYAYAPAPAPETMTYTTIDDTYFEWYKKRQGNHLIIILSYLCCTLLKDVKNQKKCG